MRVCALPAAASPAEAEAGVRVETEKEAAASDDVVIAAATRAAKPAGSDDDSNTVSNVFQLSTTRARCMAELSVGKIKDAATATANATAAATATATENIKDAATATATVTVAATATATKTATRAARHLHQGTAQELKREYATIASVSLDKDWIWKFKVFWLFPLLNQLQTLDHVFRVLFPLSYLIFIMYYGAQVNFGSNHFGALEDSECYRDSSH